jgi:hypothetical protein
LVVIWELSHASSSDQNEHYEPRSRRVSTRDNIAAAALQTISAAQPQNGALQLNRAKERTVVPTTIRSHFKGGFDELLNDIAALLLEGISAALQTQSERARISSPIVPLGSRRRMKEPAPLSCTPHGRSLSTLFPE